VRVARLTMFTWPWQHNPSTTPETIRASALTVSSPARTWPVTDIRGQNVTDAQRVLLLAAGLTLISAESLFPSKPHVSPWSGQCQPRLSHELQHCLHAAEPIHKCHYLLYHARHCYHLVEHERLIAVFNGAAPTHTYTGPLPQPSESGTFPDILFHWD
jgi:hypothetical protein